MELAPDLFWSLTFREFGIKERAFTRAEDRKRALVVQLAAMIGSGYSEADRRTLERQANALRRYPVKRWLLLKSP
jgi:hypothetical protein